MDALVVSEETLAGGTAINEGRAKRGFQPLQLVVVGVVGSGGAAKLSSTELRQKEAGLQPVQAQ
jgi:pantetheine-phosphate adenylyltransferase